VFLGAAPRAVIEERPRACLGDVVEFSAPTSAGAGGRVAIDSAAKLALLRQ